jgi:hypothetical protein
MESVKVTLAWATTVMVVGFLACIIAGCAQVKTETTTIIKYVPVKPKPGPIIRI